LTSDFDLKRLELVFRAADATLERGFKIMSIALVGNGAGVAAALSGLIDMTDQQRISDLASAAEWFSWGAAVAVGSLVMVLIATEFAGWEMQQAAMGRRDLAKIPYDLLHGRRAAVWATILALVLHIGPLAISAYFFFGGVFELINRTTPP
jgi:hypothetical protein